MLKMQTFLNIFIPFMGDVKIQLTGITGEAAWGRPGGFPRPDLRIVQYAQKRAYEAKSAMYCIPGGNFT